MKFFSWVQNKINGKQGNGQPQQATVPASKSHHVKQDSREEFNDWPNGLFSIGTFGNTDLQENQNQESLEIQQDPPLSPDLSDFTPEEVGTLQKELTKLLTRKSSSKREQSDLPLDRFLNCPSSLEVDRRISDPVSGESVDRDQEIERTISVIIHKCKEICADKNKKSIGMKSISFLFKKMFVCPSGFAPMPSPRDPFPESRMEKLLRTIIRKKMYPQNASRASSMKYIENRTNSTAEQDDERKEKICDGSKWVRTDSDSSYGNKLLPSSDELQYCSGDLIGPYSV